MVKIYSRQDLQAELTKTKTALVLFYASWCPYCMRFVPVFEERISMQKFENVINVLLDDYDNPLWDDYKIIAVPTIIYFEDGKVSRRLDGRLGKCISEAAFAEWMDELKKQ